MYRENKIADKIVDAFVDGSQEAYDVLFVYGHASATAELVARASRDYCRVHPNAKVIHENGIDFHDRFVERIKAGLNTFPWGNGEWDLLIFENIHKVAGQEFSEEIVYELLDILLQQGGQILVTGDKSVPNMLTLAPRICAQLSGGISLNL